MCLKPVFHRNLRLRWQKQHEIYMDVGLGLGVTQILAFALGETQILVFLDTNMLVSPTRNCGVWGLSQSENPS